MHASVMAPRPNSSVGALAQKVRSNASGVGGAVRAARGRVLRAARTKKWRLDRDKLRKMVEHIHHTHHEVEAEVGEFIQSPHLLFQPLRLGLTLAIPMIIPLFFMPTRLLLIYPAFVLTWYLVCLLIFATEVAMRPPWHKKGLPTKERPPYWGRFVHDPLTDFGANYESVEFPSNTVGLTLRGWFVPATTPSPSPNMVVFVHGAGQDRRSFLRHCRHFIENGYSCLLFDFSEHGLSDNVTDGMSRGTLFGAREQYDVIAAVDYMKKVKKAAHVALIGTSCGASSAILAASLRPDMSACVIAENPFTRADDLLRYHLDVLSKNYLSQNQHQTVRRAVFWAAGKVLMMRMGCLHSYGAIDAAANLACPLFVAHSTEDDMVPYEQGRAVYRAAVAAHGDDDGMVSFSSYSDAAHCALYDRDPERWMREALDFLAESFSRAESQPFPPKVVVAGASAAAA